MDDPQSPDPQQTAVPQQAEQPLAGQQPRPGNAATQVAIGFSAAMIADAVLGQVGVVSPALFRLASPAATVDAFAAVRAEAQAAFARGQEHLSMGDYRRAPISTPC